MNSQLQTTELSRKEGKPRRRLAIAGVTILAAVGMTVGGVSDLLTSTGTNTSATAPTVAVHPSAAELAEWREATATPYQRASIVKEMQAAFAGVGQVGVGPLPTQTSATTPASTSGTHDVQLVVAYGISGDHFWVTASYGDMARGAIWGAVQVCKSRGVPAWACQTAGDILTSWSYGWGSASNHGVWASIYWWGRVDGGRW